MARLNNRFKFTTIPKRFIAGIILTSCASLLGLNVSADTTLFEVSKGTQKLYLGGTIHLLRAEDLPPPAEFDAAFESSQKLVFETDMKNAQSLEFGQKFAQTMLLPNNQTLKDVLNEKTWKKLQDYSKQNNYPLSQNMRFNPAFNSIIITVVALQKLQVEQGLDNFYYQKATTSKKALGELETGDQHIAVMLAFNQENPNEIIEQTLVDIDSIQTDFAAMIDAWRSGDLKALEKNLGENMRKSLPKGYKAIVTDRNNLWLTQIEDMLKTPEVEMVLIGSLHLVGDDGLIALLKKDGYKVTPFHAKSNAH